MSSTLAHSTEPKEIIRALNTCIEICTDGQKGYAIAAADVRDPALKELFQKKSTERAGFVRSLQGAVQGMGAWPENQGTAKGAAHRGWMGVRSALEGRSDQHIVEECTRGEQEALNVYREAVHHTQLTDLPQDIQTQLRTQYAALNASLDELRELSARTQEARSRTSETRA